MAQLIFLSIASFLPRTLFSTYSEYTDTMHCYYSSRSL